MREEPQLNLAQLKYALECHDKQVAEYKLDKDVPVEFKPAYLRKHAKIREFIVNEINQFN